MSAYMVSNTHIDALLTAGLTLAVPYGPLRWQCSVIDTARPFLEQESNRRELTRETAGSVGAMLLAENRRSVNSRYREDEWEEPYLFQALSGIPDPIVVLKAIEGYAYQSCEHDGWATSEAYQFCDALRRLMIRRLPGYSDGPGWGIDDRDIFQASHRR